MKSISHLVRLVYSVLALRYGCWHSVPLGLAVLYLIHILIADAG